MVRARILMCLVYPAVIIAMLCQEASAQRDTTRQEAVTIGTFQATHQWTCQADNTLLPAGCSGDYTCRFTAGNAYTGVAYHYGDWDASTEFDRQLAIPVAAGGYPQYGDCATGTDCSGLVSICWGFGEKQGTCDLVSLDLAWNPPWTMVTAGDALVICGSHAMLVESVPLSGYVNVVEATWTDARVVRRQYPTSSLQGYGVYSAKRWYTPGCPFVYAYTESDGTLSWRVGTEVGLSHYEIMGSADGRAWNRVQLVVPAGPAYDHYSVSGGWAHWLIVAVQESGREEDVLCVPRPASKIAAPGQCAAKVSAGARAPGPVATSIALSGAISIIAPAAWYRLVNDLAGYWRLQCGYTVLEHYMPDTWSYYTVPDVDTDACREEIKNIICADAAAGAKYVLLVGGANDWREIATARSQQYWIGDFWQSKLASFRANTLYPDGQPEKDIMPTWLVAAAEMRCNECPYYCTDLPYADVVGDDGLPDIVVARFPCDSDMELGAFCEKLRAYDSCASDWGSATFVSGTYVSSRYTGEPFGMVMEMAESDILGVMPAFPRTWRLESRELWDEMAELYPAGLARLWTQIEPSVVVLQATGSGRYYPASAMNGDDMGSLQGSHNAVVIAASCGTADYMHTEWNGPDPNNQRPVCERMLARGNGAIMWIGPTSNEFQFSGAALAKAFLVEQRDNFSRPVAENFMMAQRAALAEAVHDYERYTISEYAVLGSPVMHLRNSANAAVVGVGGGEGMEEVRVFPSPSSGDVCVSIGCKARGEIVLDVYDIRGRRVRRGMSERADKGMVYWDGRGDDGCRVASGTYLVVVRTMGGIASRKITLCR